MRYYQQCECLLGFLTLAEQDGAITHIFFGQRKPEGFQKQDTAILQEAERQLNEYFARQRKAFDLPISPFGTPFQLRVWQALREIPYGETRSYKDIAQAAGCPKGFRAVGLANNRNPISIVVPCHRVIGADGSLTGFGGGLDLKRSLLRLEQAQFLEK